MPLPGLLSRFMPDFNNPQSMQGLATIAPYLMAAGSPSLNPGNSGQMLAMIGPAFQEAMRQAAKDEQEGKLNKIRMTRAEQELSGTTPEMQFDREKWDAQQQRQDMMDVNAADDSVRAAMRQSRLDSPKYKGQVAQAEAGAKAPFEGRKFQQFGDKVYDLSGPVPKPVLGGIEDAQQSRGSQAGAIIVPGKGVRQSRFRGSQYEFMDDDGQWKTTPPGTRPTSVATDSPGQRFDMSNKLRDEYQKLSGTFKEVEQSYGRINSTEATPAGDLAMLYAYTKMLDPGSVVRESEFATASTARPLMERLGLSWDAVKGVWEGRRMTPGMRADFSKSAGNLYNQASSAQDERDGQYSTLAQQYDLDPTRVVTGVRTPSAAKKKTNLSADEAAELERLRKEFGRGQ